MRPVHPSAAVLLAVAIVVAGCAETGSPGTTGPDGSSGTVTLSLAAPSGSGGAAGIQSRASGHLSPAFSVTRTDSEGNELVLDSLQLVLEEVELERAFGDDCEDDASGPGDGDDCEEFESDIRLFHVPLDGEIEKTLTIQVPAGTYDELEFEIDTPDDDEADDREFLQENPVFAEASIRAVGTFTPAGGDSDGFVFLADVDAEQEIELSPPLEVTDDGSVNLTLKVDWPRWFTEDGTAEGALFDPSTANPGGPNEDLVEENIENSFEAFEDDDEDGEVDDDADDDDDEDDGDDEDSDDDSDDDGDDDDS